MTTRDVRAAVAGERCECGHNQQRHQVPGFDGECVADGCRCDLYRRRDTISPFPGIRPALAPRPPVARSGIEQLLDAAARSGSKRTQALAQRILADVTDLYSRVKAERAAVAAETAAASARAVVNATLAKPAALPVEDLTVKPERAASVRKPSTPKTCPQCGKVCASGTGLSAHTRTAHGDNAQVPCADCGKPVAPSALGVHRYRVHGQRKAS